VATNASGDHSTANMIIAASIGFFLLRAFRRLTARA